MVRELRRKNWTFSAFWYCWMAISKEEKSSNFCPMFSFWDILTKWRFYFSWEFIYINSDWICGYINYFNYIVCTDRLIYDVLMFFWCLWGLTLRQWVLLSLKMSLRCVIADLLIIECFSHLRVWYKPIFKTDFQIPKLSILMILY